MCHEIEEAEEDSPASRIAWTRQFRKSNNTQKRAKKNSLQQRKIHYNSSYEQKLCTGQEENTQSKYLENKNRKRKLLYSYFKRQNGKCKLCGDWDETVNRLQKQMQQAGSTGIQK